MAPAPKAADAAARPPGHGLAFEGGTAYLLSLTGSVARRSWSRMLAERGLTPHHYGMLLALNELGAIGQQRLSVLIGIDPRNAVPLVDALAEAGLLVREVDVGDRRRRVLALTDSGRDMAGDLIRTGVAIERHFFRSLDAAEQAELHRLLLRLLSSAADEADEG